MEMSAPLNPMAAAFKPASRQKSNAMLNGTAEGMMEQHATMRQGPAIARTPMPTEQLPSRPKRRKPKMRVSISALPPVIDNEGRRIQSTTTRPDLNAPDMDHIMSLDNLSLNASVPPPPRHWPQQRSPYQNTQNNVLAPANSAQEQVMELRRQLEDGHREYTALQVAYSAVKLELDRLRNGNGGSRTPLSPPHDDAIIAIGPTVERSPQMED